MWKNIRKFIICLLIIIITNISSPILANVLDEDLTGNIVENVSTQISVNKEDVKLNARIGLIYDRNSGRVIYEKNGYEKYKMASTTKIMTAIIVLENSNLSDVVTVDKKAAGTGGSRLGLKTNDKITVQDLLYGLMLESGNDAAVALANYVGGSVEGFAEMMNKKAKQLELKNTHFVVPHGLDNDEHYTTAAELAKIADYALKNEKFRNIVGTKAYNVTINGKNKSISNTNELLGNLSGVYGVKTGFTNGAGRCLVTACKRGELDVITVVLGADTKNIRTADSKKLIDYAFNNYEVINIEEIVMEEFEKWRNLNEKNIFVYKGKDEQVKTKFDTLKYKKMALNKQQVNNIKVEINYQQKLEAPVEKESIIGTIKVKNDVETIDLINIKIDETIEKKGVYDYFCEILKLIS